MRTRHRCPKCDHGEILHVPTPLDTDYDRMAIGGTRSAWSAEANGQLEAYVCMMCGYTEFYVAAIRTINLSKLDGARVLRAEDRSTPYR